MRGLTINLPFKIGQTVYTVCAWGVEEREIVYYEIHKDVIYAYGDYETLISSIDNLYESYDEAYEIWKKKYN